MSDRKGSKPKLRTVEEFQKICPLVKSYVKCSKNVDSASFERNRQHVAATYRTVSDPDSPNFSDDVVAKLQAFLDMERGEDESFLSTCGPTCDVQCQGNKAGEKCWTGTLLMCTDRRVWTETILSVNDEELIVARRIRSKHTHRKVTFTSCDILSVRELREDLCPISGFGFFEVETFYMAYVFMVNDNSIAKAWVNVIVDKIGTDITSQNRQTLDETYRMPDFQWDLFFDCPSSLKLGTRRVFNYRRILFPSHCMLPQELIALTPNQIVEKALREAFAITKDAANAKLWVGFMDTVSALQGVDLVSLSAAQKMAFLLNLYHTMVIHGMLILGLPVPSSWDSFYSTVSYYVGFDVVSINELECNGLR